MFASLSLRVSVCLCLSVCLCFCLFVCLSVSPFIFSSVCLWKFAIATQKYLKSTFSQSTAVDRRLSLRIFNKVFQTDLDIRFPSLSLLLIISQAKADKRALNNVQQLKRYSKYCWVGRGCCRGGGDWLTEIRCQSHAASQHLSEDCHNQSETSLAPLCAPVTKCWQLLGFLPLVFSFQFV